MLFPDHLNELIRFNLNQRFKHLTLANSFSVCDCRSVFISVGEFTA